MVTGQKSKVGLFHIYYTLIFQPFPTFFKNDPHTAPERGRTYKCYTILERKHPSGGTLKRWA